MARTGIKVTKQRHDWDCGVAALAMLLNKSYGDIAMMVRELIDHKKLRKRGTIISDLELVASELSQPLNVVWRKKDYLLNQTGILGMIGGEMDKAGHWVVLKDGNVVVDPDDGSVWTVEDYVKKYKCRTVTLLTL